MSEITRGVTGMPFVVSVDTELPSRQLNAVERGLLAENERLSSRLEIDPRHSIDGIEARDATINGLDAQVAKLKAENEALRATTDLQKLLPEVSDALEELELHGLHSDQGYRKLKDWYRKVGLAYRVIQGPMFGAEHGELVSQNTWLRSMVEHYAQQHAPLEPIPDRDGWSTRLPGYDLPALLRDAERYRYSRDIAYSAITEEGHRIIVELPMPDRQASGADEYLDMAIDADMSKAAQ